MSLAQPKMQKGIEYDFTQTAKAIAWVVKMHLIEEIDQNVFNVKPEIFNPNGHGKENPGLTWKRQGSMHVVTIEKTIQGNKSSPIQRIYDQIEK